MHRYILILLPLLCISYPLAIMAKGLSYDKLQHSESLLGQQACEDTLGESFSQRAHELFNMTMFKRNSTDSLTRERHDKTALHRIGKCFTNIFREFNHVDSSYIEPQHYNYALMLQNTNTYEMYTIGFGNGQRVTLAPEPTYRIGPYFGWRWVFLGYTLDFSHLGTGGSSKKEYDISLYSSLFGIDLFYRETGNDYKIRSMYMENGDRINEMDGVDFDGFHANIKGFNIYYIFNHHKFSYPAAFSQSTVQRRSAGSFLLGIGYTHQDLDIDLSELSQMVSERVKSEQTLLIDTTILEGEVKLNDYSVSSGYAYNWVFAHNWLFDVSMSLALGYKYTFGDSQNRHFTFRDFKFNNFNVDGVGRFGLIWNNTKWYAGASAVFHTYNYKKSAFWTNNMFGSVNFYVGFNFGKR